MSRVVESGRARPVPVGRRSALLLGLTSLTGLLVFFWPLFIPVSPASQGHGTDAPFVFIIILPVLVAIVLTQLSEGGMDSKGLAMLGVLSALNAALRPLGAGVSGIETVFFLLILAGWVFGPGFGFVLGCTSMFASALLTAGVGPWLPFQMLTSAWIGMLAGLLPHSIRGRAITGRKEIALLAAFGVFAAYLFGFLMNMWFWPFVTGAGMGEGSGLAYVPGAPVLENLHRYIVFTVVTSSVGWDTGRAITNAAAIIILGPSILLLLRRAVRRANFTAEVRFTS